MITYLVCDQDALVFQEGDAWNQHFIDNPTHTSHTGVGGDSSSPTNYATSSTISEVTSDPSSPTSGQTWVLATPSITQGSPIGILLALTYATTIFTYRLSYRTAESTTVRVGLS
jgi:hypothetical protein